MKKNTSWKFTDELSVTFQSSVSGVGEFSLSIEIDWCDASMITQLYFLFTQTLVMHDEATVVLLMMKNPHVLTIWHTFK